MVILKELRYQAETRFRFTLYKRPEFRWLQSMNIKHIFQPLDDLEHGSLGILHLQFVNEDGNKYWKGTWYENAIEVFAVAQEIQNKKEEYIDENKIIDAQIRYMKSFVIDTTVPELVN